MGTWEVPPLSSSDFNSQTTAGAVDFEPCDAQPVVDFMQGPMGPTGPSGPVGPTGPGGVGNRWWDGIGPPTIQPGMQVGDYYLDTRSGLVYELEPARVPIPSPPRTLTPESIPYQVFMAPVDQKSLAPVDQKSSESKITTFV